MWGLFCWLLLFRVAIAVLVWIALGFYYFLVACTSVLLLFWYMEFVLLGMSHPFIIWDIFFLEQAQFRRGFLRHFEILIVSVTLRINTKIVHFLQFFLFLLFLFHILLRLVLLIAGHGLLSKQEILSFLVIPFFFLLPTFLLIPVLGIPGTIGRHTLILFREYLSDAQFFLQLLLVHDIIAQTLNIPHFRSRLRFAILFLTRNRIHVRFPLFPRPGPQTCWRLVIWIAVPWW